MAKTLRSVALLLVVGSANLGCDSTEGSTGGAGGTASTTSAGEVGGQTSTQTSSGGTSTSGLGGSTGTATTDAAVYGELHSGQFHLGPVDFAESDWTNACNPAGGYVASMRDAVGLHGEYLAGVSNTYALNGGACDACILIKTGQSRQIVARVITYGVTNDPGDIDVSPSVYDALNTGEYPRSMTWQFAKCPADTGTILFEFQTEANEWWTSLWVRDARVPVTKVEVQSTNHSSFVALARGTDGTLTDASGFGAGSFTLRLTAMDGQVITDTQPSFTPGQIIVTAKQFQ
jgi:expansin